MANIEYRDAVRILFLLVEGAVENPDPDTSPGYPRRFEGETRLQALDFWVRYPDYLADELLAQYLESGDHAFLHAARAIFDHNEPSEKAIPMLRRYFGAYEPLDTVLSILAVAGLGPVDKVDSQIIGSMIQDCFLGGSFGSRRPDGYGMADHRGAVAHRAGEEVPALAR